MNVLVPQILFQTVTDDIQHVCSFTPDLEHHAGRIAGKLFAAHGGIPAYDNAVVWCPRRRLIVKLEPVPFDKVATLRDRRLLVLRCEVLFPKRSPHIPH